MLSINEELSKRISKVVLKHNYYTVYFSETADGTHSFESRLNGAKIERSVFIDDLKTKMLPELKLSEIDVDILLEVTENAFQVVDEIIVIKI